MTHTKNPIALLFPGQGSQVVGMGRDLFEKHSVARLTFEEADDVLGYKLSRLCFEGPEEQLRLTEITQPAILTVSFMQDGTKKEDETQNSGRVTHLHSCSSGY